MTAFLHRAVAQGFYNGMLVNEGATFVAHDGFEADWAAPIEGDHSTTLTNTGAQEAISEALAPAIPVIDNPEAILPAFHPTVAVASAVDLALEQVDATNPERAPVETSAQTTSTSDPAKAEKRTRRTSEQVKADAQAASDAEVEAKKAKDEGADLV